MAVTDDKLFTDRYLTVYDPSRKAMELRRKSQAHGSLSLLQTMELIETMLKTFQGTYKVDTYDKNTIHMPFMFVEPKPGDRVLNENTGEVYVVDHTIRNPTTNKWEGLIRFEVGTEPKDVLRETLRFLDDRNYVVFGHNFANGSPNDLGTNSTGEGVDAPSMRPMVSWFIARKEPGASQTPFGPRKEWKARQREEFKDPFVRGHTVIVSGQTFDNIVQFDALYSDNKSAEHLIEWFEQFIRLYRWILREKGVVEMFFWRRQVDETTREWRQPLWKRSTQYYFRTEQLEAVYTRDLLRVNMSLEVTTGRLTPGNQEPRYIADQLVSGDLTASGYRRLFYTASGTPVFWGMDLKH